MISMINTALTIMTLIVPVVTVVAIAAMEFYRLMKETELRWPLFIIGLFFGIALAGGAYFLIRYFPTML